MKTSFICLLLAFLCFFTFAQAPSGFNYQGIARDNLGKEIANKNISLRLSILQTSTTGISVYIESHAVTTNSFGLFTLKVGSGSVISGNINQIDWFTGLYFLKVEMDPAGGSSYTFIGTSQLLSVPYAMMANRALKSINDMDTSANNEIQTLKLSNDTLYLDRGGKVYLRLSHDLDTSTVNELQSISLTNDTLYLENGGMVYLGYYNDKDEIMMLKNKVIADSSYFETEIAKKQDKLKAGSGITIDGFQKISAIDTSTANELQFLSYSNDTLYLSKGNFAILPFSKIVPKDNCIMSLNSTAPSGYAYSGKFFYSVENWSQQANLATAKHLCRAVVLNNKIYLVGGVGSAWTDENHLYDPATNTWTTKASMPTARAGHALAAVNGKIYAIAGNNNGALLNTVIEYDPTSNTWTSKANMSTSRWLVGYAVLNNIIYVMGGYNGSISVSTVEAYDPANNSWSTKHAMTYARHALVSAAVNNKIYAICGNSTQNEVYNPATDTWSTVTSLGIARYGAAVAVLNSKIVLLGGDDQDGVVEYSPVSNSWSTKLSLPVGISECTAVSIGTYIYVFGGKNPSGELNSLYRYDSPNAFYIHCKN